MLGPRGTRRRRPRGDTRRTPVGAAGRPGVGREAQDRPGAGGPGRNPDAFQATGTANCDRIYVTVTGLDNDSISTAGGFPGARGAGAPKYRSRESGDLAGPGPQLPQLIS